MARRYVLGVAVGTALALSLTGCNLGGAGGPKKAAAPAPAAGLSAQDALARLSQRTNQVRSFRVETDISSAVAGQSVKMNGHGDVRLRPSLAQRWTIAGMTVSGTSVGGFEEIVLGDSIYLKPPANTLSTRKPWIRLSLRQMSAKAGLDYASTLSEQSDPSMTVKMLTAAKDAHEVGRETVGGVPATHFRGTYSITDAVAKLDAKHRAATMRMYQQLGVDKMTFDLWVDGRQLPRKVTLATPAGAKVTMAVTTTYSGFDAPVSISAPPRNQVSDGSHLIGRVPGVPA